MLNIKTVLPIVFMMVFGAVQVNAQVSTKAGASVKGSKANALTETLVIATSAQCDMCRMRIEGRFNDAKGVRSATLDIRSKKLTIKYNPEKTNPEELKKALTDLGYDANEAKANPEAYKNLPACCQKH